MLFIIFMLLFMVCPPYLLDDDVPDWKPSGAPLFRPERWAFAYG